jgi:hypothetical protein
MREPSAERAGTLILRAWVETRHDRHLRIRVLSVIEDQGQTLGVVASLDELWIIVRIWLENLLGRGARG